MKPVSRRSFLATSGSIMTAAACSPLGRVLGAEAAGTNPKPPTARDTLGLRRQDKKIPVIFDSDIGDDIDDTWALALMLKSPEFDVRLVAADYTNTVYRAKIFAKMLEVAGRTDIPIAIGPQKDEKPGRQSAWVGNYDLAKYPGKVHEDGISAIIDTIRAAEEPITLVAVGPAPNIAEVVRRAPDVARKARFVGMHGSVRRGYGGSPDISAEWNVKADPKALQQVFAADWDITVTPLDTCGLVHLTGEKFQQVYRSEDPLVKALMANYQAWREAQEKKKLDPPDRSSTLFDTVAVYLGMSQRLVDMETINLRVTDDGFTRIDPAGRPVHCAMNWKSLPAFEDLLVRRLTAG